MHTHAHERGLHLFDAACGKLTIFVKPSKKILLNSFTQVLLSALLTGRMTWKDSLNLPVTHNQTDNIRFSSENRLIIK